MCVQTIVIPKAMNGIKLAKWRYFLTMFFFLTSVSLAIDCLYKIGMPFRNVLELILKNAALPAIIVAGNLLLGWARKR
jgi:hypothetical protein